MHIAHPFMVMLLGAAVPVSAQSASPLLNLQLPASSAPALSSPTPESKSNPGPAASTTPPSAPAPPSPYDETYGTRRDAAQKECDDKTYSQPQVHGSFGVGVAGGNRVSGNYQTATIVATKALGSCDDPKGIVRASISVSKSNVNLRRGGRP
jgi:hypothetical protein